MNKIRSIQVIRKLSFQQLEDTETVVWNFCRSLAKKGNETEILATKALSDVSAENVEEISLKRFEYFYPYLNISEAAKNSLDNQGGNPYSLQLYGYLMKIQKIDILHSHTASRITNIVRLTAKKKRIPYIVTIHVNDFSESEMKERSELLEGTLNYGKIFDSILKNNRYLSDADGIICVRQNDYLTTQEKYPDKIVEYIPNGIDLDKFKLGSSRHFRERHNINIDADILLCVGKIDPLKNQLKLIELLNLLNKKRKSAHLILIGRIASESYYQKLLQRCKELRLEDRISIITDLQENDPELVKAYHAADFFVLPFIQEPFSQVALEAWASRLPVIAHKVGGLQDLITEKHNGLFYQNDSLEDLAAQYYLLKDHPDLRVKLIHNAYEDVCEKYSWPIVTDKILDFYQKVIEKYRLK